MMRWLVGVNMPITYASPVLSAMLTSIPTTLQNFTVSSMPKATILDHNTQWRAWHKVWESLCHLGLGKRILGF